jgi:hypothetical protein
MSDKSRVNTSSQRGSLSQENLDLACHSLEQLLAAMRRWGANEDGIPEDQGIADAYDEAATFLGLPRLKMERND